LACRADQKNEGWIRLLKYLFWHIRIFKNGILIKYGIKTYKNKRQMFYSASGLIMSSRCLLGHLLITFACPSRPARRGKWF